jgi:hypothetical protein
MLKTPNHLSDEEKPKSKSSDELNEEKQKPIMLSAQTQQTISKFIFAPYLFHF